MRQLKRNPDNSSHNTTAYVQILGTGLDTQETVPSVLLFFDKQRFIFNAGEGLQRFCTEHKIKLSKIDHICLSRICSETAGGLPGLLLTLAGMGEGLSVNIWGPSNLQMLVQAMSSFIPHAALIHTHLISANDNRNPTNGCGIGSSSEATQLLDRSIFQEPTTFYKNNVVKVSAVSLCPNSVEGSSVMPSDVSLVYICELSDIMGKFSTEKADALGLKVKSKYRALQSGQPVKSDTLDIMVYPNDVMGPSIPGPIVFIVDCPTESHAEKLYSTQSLDIYHSEFLGHSVEKIKIVNCIVHLSPASVVNSPDYQKWMRKFGSAQHIMARNSMMHAEIPILRSSARIATRLNFMCPQLFPASIISTQNPDVATAEPTFTIQDTILERSSCQSAENLLKFVLRPHTQLGLDRSNVPCLMSASEIVDQLRFEMPEVKEASEQICQLWNRAQELKFVTHGVEESENIVKELSHNGNNLPSCMEDVQRNHLELVFLGTGSSMPSKYRNVSSIYVNLFSRGSMLLDCGEGTLAQLKRRYGVQGADEAVRNLRCIWISHIHADHHAGLVRVLALRRDLLKGSDHEPLLVIGPEQLEKFLDAYQRLEDLDMLFLDSKHTMAPSWDAFQNHYEATCPGSPTIESRSNPDIYASAGKSYMHSCSKRQKLERNLASPLLKKLVVTLHESGLETLVSVPVVHCTQAFGLVLQAAERKSSFGKVIPGWKIVYSGDTRPCRELTEASKGATILIHEATFEDCLMEEAIARNHSTIKEAIDVGNSAGVYRTILTHFSQRYPKVPSLDEVSGQRVCIAFDLMSVNLADLPVLPQVLPYLKLLFREEMTQINLEDL